MDVRKKVLTFVFVISLLSVFFPAPTGIQQAQANAGAGNNLIYLPMISNSLPTVIPDSTNILTDESNQYLVSISADAAQLVFSQTTSELDKVEPGEVIVSGIANTAPNGYLCKVLTKEVVNRQVVLTTEPASLEEAIEQSSLSFTYHFSQADIIEANLLSGVSLATATQSSAAPNVQVINLQLDRAMLGGQVEASGSLALDMFMDFSFSIKYFSLKSMRMVLIATETSALNLTSLKEAAGDEDYEIARFRLTPMTIIVG